MDEIKFINFFDSKMLCTEESPLLSLAEVCKWYHQSFPENYKRRKEKYGSPLHVCSTNSTMGNEQFCHRFEGTDQC